MLIRVLVMCVLAGAACSATTATEPIDIGSRLELFVDNFLIEQMSGGAELRLHRPTEREVVFTCDKPWEGNASGLVTFIQDGDTYRMYYRAAMWEAHIFICYAESPDGIHWTRPELGQIEFEGSKKNNILNIPGEGRISTFVPFKDTNPDCKPDEQYKAMVYRLEPSRSLYAYASADGFRWRLMRQEPIITKGAFDSQNVAFWDSVRGRYVAFFRETRGPIDEMGLKGPQLGLDDNGPARDVLTSTSPDYLHWTEPKWLQYPGAPREQVYYNQIQPYHRAPHIFVGFPARYMAGREIEKGLPLPSIHSSYTYASISETMFMTSRDGVRFKRWGEAFIRPGPSKERWIYAATMARYGIVVTKADIAGRPDELSLYVDDGSGFNQRGDAASSRRYTLRIDGFVSVNAPLSGGEFITKSLTFEGKELVMNFSSSAAGSVQAEIQDSSGKPIKGFALADCPEIFGDQIEHAIAWKSGGDVSELAGKPIRLRFLLKDADLYSIQFQQ